MKNYQLSDFATVRFMTAGEKFSVLENFKKIIEQRTIHLLDQHLYQHLHLHCGFMAHFDIDGFRSFYAEMPYFLGFCETFLNQNVDRFNWRSMADYQDINQAMLQVAMAHIPAIRQEAHAFQMEKERELFHQLAEKHGIKIQESVQAGEQVVRS
jgi:hypothetical protein